MTLLESRLRAIIAMACFSTIPPRLWAITKAGLADGRDIPIAFIFSIKEIARSSTLCTDSLASSDVSYP